MSPAVSDLVQVILELKNLRQFTAGTDKAASGVEKVGKETDKAGKKSKLSAKNLLAWGGAATAIYGATRFLKGAVNATEELGKSTLALQRTTGMDIKTSSEWATVIKSRGVQTKAFQMGLTKLSAQIGITAAGTKKHDSALEKLGITTNDVAVQTGNTQGVLLEASDALSHMTNYADRAALAQKLFGRQGIALAPILFRGSQAIKEQLGLADEYGATLSGKSKKAVLESIQHQRELGIALQGVKIQLGTALLPVLVAVIGLFIKLLKVLQPLTKSSVLFKLAIVGVVGVLIAYKTAMVVATIVTTVFDTALTVTQALLAFGIPLAIIALIAALYLLWTRVSWFRKGVLAAFGAIKLAAVTAFNWVKDNWPMLIGILIAPWAVAAIQIVKHWDAIKQGARMLVNFVIAQFKRLLRFIATIPGKIPGLLGKAGGAVGRVLSYGLKHAPGAGKALVGAAAGGHVQQAGSLLVGERGPEVVSVPRAATITPLSSSSPGVLAAAGMFDTAHITTQVVLDRRVLAEAVGRFTADKLARR